MRCGPVHGIHLLDMAFTQVSSSMQVLCKKVKPAHGAGCYISWLSI
jgi:hypothetical protein